MTTICSDMLLALDTSSAACTAALFDGSGLCIAAADECVGRGHAERLVPMIAELVGEKRPSRILVGIGPGSFTGIRVAVAAAHGLAIGWGAQISGMSSLALLAAAASSEALVGTAILGGHGELFIQQFDGTTLEPVMEVASAIPENAATLITAPLVVGSGARALVEARGWGEHRDALPSAARALMIPKALRSLPAAPLYVRAPDARIRDAA